MKTALRLFALLLLCLTPLRAEDITVQATGYGPTLDAAVRAARRAALEQGVGQVITSSSEMENFMLKKDIVLTRTEGSVKSSQILSQTQGPDGAWEVSVSAVVSKDGIRSDLAALLILREAVGNPRIAILVKETVLGEAVEEGTAEAQLINFFQERSFEVVEASDAVRSKRQAQIDKAATGDAAAAAALGAELGAEVVIVGTAVATEADVSQNAYFQGSGMKSASARVALKAVDVTTREILAAKSGDAPMVHINPAVAGSKAIEKAIGKLLDKKDSFSDKLIASWQQKANDGQVIRVRVRNIPSFAASQVVQEELKGDAVTVTQRKLADGVLFLDVVWRGTAEDFCSSIDGRKINKERNVLNVSAREGNSVVLEVK